MPARLPADQEISDLENSVASLISDYELQCERIGRLLHDDIGQILSGVGLQLEGLRMDLKSLPELAAQVTEVQSQLEVAMSRVREISNQLNPSVVERAGLGFALEQLADRIREKFNGTVRLHCDSSARLPKAIAVAFYRVAEYALGQALRQAHSTQIDVRLKTGRNGTILELCYNGDSVAPETANPAARVEFLKLHYHAHRAGIAVTVESSPGKGTLIRTSYRADS